MKDFLEWVDLFVVVQNINYAVFLDPHPFMEEVAAFWESGRATLFGEWKLDKCLVIFEFIRVFFSTKISRYTREEQCMVISPKWLMYPLHSHWKGETANTSPCHFCGHTENFTKTPTRSGKQCVEGASHAFCQTPCKTLLSKDMVFLFPSKAHRIVPLRSFNLGERFMRSVPIAKLTSIYRYTLPAGEDTIDF